MEVMAKSLNDLEGPAPAPKHESYLTATCHDLRAKPIDEFIVEDLRLMIGQAIGLEHLLPVALDHLEKNPFAEGDFYPGDLLAAVLSAPRDFLARKAALRKRIHAILGKAEEALHSPGGPGDPEEYDVLIDRIASFKAEWDD